MRLRGEMIMDRLLIIDGSNLLFKCFLACLSPLPFVLHELKYSYNGITTNEVLKEIKLR